ncbi:MAG: hypothetical protein JSV52_07180 [Candidatus Zixiibacteriota bacterium]|nr:MAG: hypothetical protein JSV52_07180 [candidate division Zixibacteria bacterium]
MRTRGERRDIRNDRGISLVEITMLVVIIAIVMAVAMQSMTPGIENARKRKTEHEMEAIIKAIAGDPSLMTVAGGVRADFGYVGDIGAFPPDLDALVENPGSYSTWKGPYIPPELINGFKTDEWGVEYTYNGGLDIESHGSGSPMRHRGSIDSLDILYNTVSGLIRDVNDSVPGPVFDDSIDVEITIPDGAGSVTTKVYHPDSAGEFSLDSIPIGRHYIEAIYTPEVDTLSRCVVVLPRHSSDEYMRFNFASAWFSTEDTSGGGSDSMLTLVEGTAVADGPECEDVTFDLANNTGEDVLVESMTATWSGSTAYYQTIRWGGTVVFIAGSTRNGSGELADIDDQTVVDGDTLTIVIEAFKNKSTGSASSVNMGSRDFTIEFSDGSIIEFTTPSCP